MTTTIASASWEKVVGGMILGGIIVETFGDSNHGYYHRHRYYNDCYERNRCTYELREYREWIPGQYIIDGRGCRVWREGHYIIKYERVLSALGFTLHLLKGNDQR